MRDVYEQVNDTVIELYAAGRYDEALGLVDQALGRIPDRSADLVWASERGEHPGRAGSGARTGPRLPGRFR